MSNIINTLQALLQKKGPDIHDWFHAAYTHDAPCFYTSVDIRHSGNKLVPVDTNVFPAGFNNLTEDEREHAKEVATAYLDRYFPNAQTIALLPETHTRNLYYLDNLHCLQEILSGTGRAILLGALHEGKDTPFTLTSASDHVVEFFPLRKEDNTLIIGDKTIPDIILLNNDLTSGMPKRLEGITQPVIPSSDLGWHQRSKTTHFASYRDVVQNFSKEFDIEPFFITGDFHLCQKVYFKAKENLECVALGAERLLHRLQEQYATYGITEEPYVCIKADRGTYGMGVMTAHSGDEVYALNKKNRHRMDTIKEGTLNSEVLIQEGIRTVDRVNGYTAEPMVYLIGGKQVGRFYRVNHEKDDKSNLNTPGMHFDNHAHSMPGQSNDAIELVAKLASLAVISEKQVNDSQ